MGTKVHHSMRDLNQDCRWPLYYGDNSNTSPNDHCFPSQSSFGYDKDVVRRTMLEHEAVFKTQVLELHRVYSVQKDMIDDLKRKQLNKDWIPNEASCSSQPINDDALKWKMPSFPLANSVYDRPSMSVVEDNGHSPIKGSNSQGFGGAVQWQNGASSKNVEMSEVRPTKVRKKMIDLCLPADEYIDDSDEVVELKDHRACGTSSQLPNGDVKTESRGDSLRIGYGFSSRGNGLADLNEPVKAQETSEFPYRHSRDLRNGEFQGHIRDYGKSLNTGSVREHVPVISLHPDENGTPKFWSHQPLRIDHYSGTHKPTTPFLQQAKPLNSSSQPMHVSMNTSQRVMGLPNSGPPSKAGLWRERTFIDLEADTDTNSSHEAATHQNHLESSLVSHQPRHLYPYNPSDSAVPWNHLHSSWQNPSFGFPQKVASAQRYPVLNLSDTLSGNAQNQKQGCLGDRLQFESNSRFNSGCGSSSRLNQNMFYNECSSSSKPKFPENGYSYPNGGRTDYIPANPFMNSSGSEMKSVRDLNLNVTFSNTSVAEVRKDQEHLATLPWLMKPKSICNSEMADRNWNLNINDAVPSSSFKPLDIKDEAGSKDQNNMWLERLKSGSCTNKLDTEKSSANLKIPAFGYRDQSSAEKGKVHNVRMLDMNAPGDTLSDEDQETEEQSGTKVSGSNRCPIDLNMSVSEDEDKNWSAPTSSRRNLKAHMMIDLEAAPESEDEEVDDEISGEKSAEETPIEENTLEIGPEFEKIAADTMVAISSASLNREREVVASAQSPENVILHWFAETVDTHRENLEQKLKTFSRNQARSIEEIDDFEAMTLQLPEITEDEYMPKPLVPEDLKLEETSGAAALVTSQRPRRGNARKGKQRRDFQRDILPGLLSLSKLEVTEDIHMFDGFMRAAGSSWTTPTGLSRKKTGARGRPRRVITIPEPVYCPAPAPAPVQQHVSNQNNSVSNQSNNGDTEMGLEDRSFAGWGKMTRRPRRQRCPAPTTANNQRCSSSHAPFA